MKSLLSILLLLFAIQLINAQEKNAYVGVAVCSPCHKTEKQGNQFGIWKSSKHSSAMKTLQTAEADSIAKSKGCSTPAAETKECLKCHATGYDIDKSLIGEKFDINEGVQCETCHGPGSNYKSMKIMKDKELAVKNGLILHEDKEAFCTSCHNSGSPTFKGFEFAAMWDKIKHPIPKEKK
jgi:hypothetical protein